MRIILFHVERFVENYTRVQSNENQQPGRLLEPDGTSMNIGGFDVSFVTSPRFARTLPRRSTGTSSGSAGPRNLDSTGRRTPLQGRATPRLSLKDPAAALPPVPGPPSGGWQSQPCSPGVALQRRHHSSSSRHIFALEGFISTFHHVNRGGSQIGKLGKFQVTAVHFTNLETLKRKSLTQLFPLSEDSLYRLQRSYLSVMDPGFSYSTT